MENAKSQYINSENNNIKAPFHVSYKGANYENSGRNRKVFFKTFPDRFFET